MSKEKQIDIITDLLIDFDEMGFAPTTLVPNPEAYAIEWKKKLTDALQGYLKQSEGEWKVRIERSGCFGDDDVDVYYKCSCCGVDGEGKSPYCPNCGAKMKGGGE